MDSIKQVRDKARALRAEFDAAAAAASDEAALQALRDRFLGRKSGALSALLKSLGQLPDADRREAGQELNAAKAVMEQKLEALGAGLDLRRRDDSLRRDRLDATLPGRHPYVPPAARSSTREMALAMERESPSATPAGRFTGFLVPVRAAGIAT